MKRFFQRILFPTIAIAALGALLLTLAHAAFAPADEVTFGTVVYITVMLFLNVLVPSFLAVVVASLLHSALVLPRGLSGALLFSALLAAIFWSSLWLWALGDVILYYGGLSGVTWKAVTEDFRSEFFGYLPIAAFAALVIPWFRRFG